MKTPRTILQVSPLPYRLAMHVVEISGSLQGVVNQKVENWQEHTAPGGYVGIAPYGPGGAVVQLHSADGTIEAWIVYTPR